jgi:Na+-transporting methylmalonyl-CoA/oxaloacetate decarboxylase gamma subunit
MSADGHDQWHQHTAAEGAPQEEHAAQASAKALGLTFIAMTLGVLFVIIVLVVYFRSYMSNYESQINENTEAAALFWEYKSEKLAAIEEPVAGAIDKVIAEYAQN